MQLLIQNPARLVPLAFLVLIALGTALLMLPVSRPGSDSASFLAALFTATSAVCVTGLAVVDTASYWSRFGQGVILILLQIGGFGIMSGATLLGMLVTRRLRLSSRLIAQAETRGLELGEVAQVLRLVFTVMITIEFVTAVILAVQLHVTYRESWPEAIWNGLFLSVAAFTNAGFSTYPDSVARFALDPVIVIPIMIGVAIGGLGFPVLQEIRREPRRFSRWSVHARLTMLGTTFLFVGGGLVTLVLEFSNPATIGAFSFGDKVINAMFHSIMTRSGGLNAVDVGQMRTETHFLSYVLMLIGGGSASTAGGVKVTTFLILGAIARAEARGDQDVNLFGRRIPLEVQRQAITIVLLAGGLTGLGVMALLSLTEFTLEQVLFEVISALATVGLSTGITPALPPAAQVVIIALMFVGRVGPATVAAALALRSGQQPYRYPEERPIVG